LFVCHVLETGDPDAPSRLGLSASKRTGPSHDRIRYKRWAREVFRRHSLRSGADVVVSFRQAMASAGFAAFRAALIEAFERAGLVRR
jgi:ribonuclease P protein component